MIFQVPKSFSLQANKKYLITGYLNGRKIFQFGNEYIDFELGIVEIFTSFDKNEVIVFLEQLSPYQQVKL